MNFYKLYTGIIICLFSTNLFAQTDEAAPAKGGHKWTIYGGAGPNVYFNNLVIGRDNVNQFQYSFAGRIMWEPEHLLSLGVESGYYRLYSVSFPEFPDVKISNSAIPIFIVVSMKFLKSFYFNFSSGQTILLNNVYTPTYGHVDESALSFGDFAGSLGYKRQLKKHISLSAEVKFFDSTKLDDKNMALLFLAGYSF
jgi:hypothetical protein